MSKDFRAEAEAHWEFIEKLLDTCTTETVTKETLKFLYIEAMVHGYKHAIQEDKEKGYNGPG
jgi:hypothetical protein